jgi:putative SOS response-associated peptidase YedK
MCGRFTLATTASDLAREFEIEVAKSITSRYNIAPSQPILAIRQNESNKPILDVMKWGLIPSWVKNLDSWKSNLINARAETVAEKPSFRGAFKYRPCLIPVSGFYEWTKEKQPYYFQLENSKLFALAGLWESWSNGEDELVSCTIVTTEANREAAKIHHRMPVIIQPEDYPLWLGKLDERKQLLTSLPEIDLNIYPVSKTVNSPKNDKSECIEPINSR